MALNLGPIAGGQDLYFVHVPRSGGRSVAHWLGVRNYSPDHGPAPPGALAFGVLRDPYERVVSEYRFRFPDRDPEGFEPWVLNAERVFVQERWSAKSLLQGCHIMRFDHLEADVRDFLSDVGVAADPPDALPHVLWHPNRGAEQPRSHPLEAYMTDKAAELIASLCAWDLQMLASMRRAA